MGKRKVLVIDDEQIVLDSVKKILTQEDYDVDAAISSRKGLDMAIKNIYDIVLTDIRMPEIGGMRILRDIKRAKPSVPVVIITGYATVQSAVQAMKLGATDYIEKPFTPEELLKAVESALEVASRMVPEEQKILHKEKVIEILERAATDSQFAENLFANGTDALEEYRLTAAEKIAILTADIPWIESHIGKLSETQKRWLLQRLSAEIW
jgi:DNA-binding NtrC family response regulator